jgi:hypothetical protein
MYQFRSIGVTIVAIIHFIFAVLTIPRIVVVLDYPFRMWSFPLFGYRIFSDPFVFVTDNNRSIILLLVVIQLVVYLVTALGIWKLKEWSRLLAIFNTALSIIAIGYRNFMTPITGSTFIEVIVLLFIVVYLNLPSVSGSFR